MMENYYFSPTSPNPAVINAKEEINELREKSYDFCTPWQSNNHLSNEN